MDNRNFVERVKVPEWSVEDLEEVLEETDAELDTEMLETVYNDYVLEEEQVPYRELDIFHDDMERFTPDSLLENGEGLPVKFNAYREQYSNFKWNDGRNKYVDVVQVLNPKTEEVIVEYQSRPYLFC